MKKNSKYEYINSTIEMLGIRRNDKSLAKKEFCPIKSKKDNSKAILIIGINPSGNSNNAKIEKNDDYYGLYYVPNYKIAGKKEQFVFPNYHKPVHDFLENIVGEDNIKYDWNNVSKQKIDKFIKNNIKNRNNQNCIYDYYIKHKNAKYTVYFGEMFAYHDKSQQEIIKLLKNNSKNSEDIINHCKKTLEYYIDILSFDLKKEISFIYINNAQVSRWLTGCFGDDAICEKKIKTTKYKYKYKSLNIDVFYGGMLSGGRAIDVFSKQRLINEIKNTCRLNTKNRH